MENSCSENDDTRKGDNKLAKNYKQYMEMNSNNFRKILFSKEHHKELFKWLPITSLAAQIYKKASGSYDDQFNEEFISKLDSQLNITPCALVLAILYIERLMQTDRECSKHLLPSELFVISMLIATKYLIDEGEENEIWNDEWAKAANFEIDRVVQLERIFLNRIKWNLFISPATFHKYTARLEARMIVKEFEDRNWLTYAEMKTLLDLSSKHTLSTIGQIIKIVAVSITSYLACFIIVVGSLFLIYTYQNNHLPYVCGGNNLLSQSDVNGIYFRHGTGAAYNHLKHYDVESGKIHAESLRNFGTAFYNSAQITNNQLMNNNCRKEARWNHNVWYIAKQSLNGEMMNVGMKSYSIPLLHVMS
ncbi:Protein CNPPD1 [Trichoplax sp. H2]|uniref:Protein CNPPD1 n=1 Tax=Trichoplax adhaerens TaxID=10228 RepID=B3RRX7_TRIAD|nr:hypothetical protein TRIADDRAFT_54402 [Trichoplax adhaerens]EDV26949.1 hypothetical protein TRIADDRAFT_54402 [Trichoplax adhaerens]RDD41023.1 Protein CNPPD1 [Trichoplax sp. H2]|eukprot:XP_002110945.1 hypothetical protein TRIADDRAFT_54402 [Trichoplax adhaerens]